MAVTSIPWNEQIHPFTGRLRLRPPAQILVGVLLVAAAFPFRFSVSGGRTASLFDVALACVGMAFLVTLPARNKPKLPKPFVRLALISILISVASIGWSQNATNSTLYTISTGEGVAAFVMVIALLKAAPPEQIIRLIGGWIFLILTGSALLWLHVPAFMPPQQLDPTSGDYVSYFARLSHPLIGRSNNLAAILSLFIFPLAVWARRKNQKLAGLIALVSFMATALTFSRGSLISLVCGLLLYLLLDGKAGMEFLRKMILPAVIVGGAIWFVISSNGIVGEYFSSRFDDAGAVARINLMTYAQQIFLLNWQIGTGAGTGDDVHNTFIQQLVYFGLFLGLVVCGLLLGIVLWWFGKHHGESRWFARAIGIGFAVQFGSLLFESSYEGALLRPLIWMSWGLLVALLNAERLRSPVLV